MSQSIFLQDTWKQGTCYGCGPNNPDGLKIKSRWSDDGRFVVAQYNADAKYNAGMHDVMYGGTVASLIDCHCVWTAIAFARKAENRSADSPPSLVYVTGKLEITYLKPTPLSKTLHIRAWADGEIGKSIRVLCELGPRDDVTATGVVTAVRLDSPHAAVSRKPQENF